MADTLIRPYAPADRAACLTLFDSNLPEYFSAAERAEFAAFVDRPTPGLRYFLVERHGVPVACGGVAPESDGMTATLCWGMVERRQHTQGLGTLLTQARLEAARAMPGVTQVEIGTSQKTSGFYARFGFLMTGVIPDGYGPGLDRCDMVFRLTDRR